MREQKHFARYKKPQVEMPNLVETHLKSYKWLLEVGLKEAFKEFSPIEDYSGKKFALEFVGIELSAPKYDEYFAKENKLSYEAPLKARVKLINKTFKSEKEQEIFMADFPMMTSHGTFIVNGVERVVVPQISRSFGVSFIVDEIKGKRYFGAKIIPGRGAWVEIESDPDGAVYVRIDKKRKFPVTVLLRALGLENNDAIVKAFAKSDDAVKKVIEATLAKDPSQTPDDSFIEIHKKLRDGDLATAENARGFVNSIFAKEKYDLSEVGRFKFNKRFGKGLEKTDIARRTIDASDVATIVGQIVKLNADPRALPDDIDHLGSRRIRSVGEMLQQKIRVGMTQMKRNIQDRMSTIDT
ncbi:MAG: DNA-directed RNA polymerase subunit beta, partial [Minisyncoccia bacterium]